MTNSEKVRLAVAHCLRSNDISICEECPYNVGNDYGCRKRLRDDIIALLKVQEPVAVKHIHEEYPEHVWKKDENGKIDEWASEDSESTHHGPVCERCLDSFCVACEPNGYETHKKCIIDDYVCPICGKSLWKNQKHCDKCGQAVKWE